jgi:predicted transcriptional regulator
VGCVQDDHAEALKPYVDTVSPATYTDGMEVNLSPELEAKLNRKAAEQGRNSQSLIQEAVERLVDYDEWFIREVETGLAAADRGEFVEHDEVGKLIDSRFPG